MVAGRTDHPPLHLYELILTTTLRLPLQVPMNGQLTSMHFYGWKKGLKTGMYYLRTKSASQAIQFTVDAAVTASVKAKQAQHLR